MIPILPYIERGVKFIGDLIYLLQCPEYNGLVPNLCALRPTTSHCTRHKLYVALWLGLHSRSQGMGDFTLISIWKQSRHKN